MHHRFNNRSPLCPVIHAAMIASGHSHIAHSAGCEDRGNGETGPMVSHWSPCDEYLTVLKNGDVVSYFVEPGGEVTMIEWDDAF